MDQSRLSCLRTRMLAAALGLSLLGAEGCARVDGTADFQRASQLIQDHTGVEATGQPESEFGCPDRVTELLQSDLTIEAAVRIALLNNREFLSLFYEIGVSRAEVVQSGLLTNPSLSLLYRLPEGGGRPDIELSIAQEIADLWQIPVKKKIAKAQLEQTILKVVDRAIALAADVKTKYYELLAARMAQATAEQSTELVLQSVKSVQEQMRQGEVSRLDVNLQRVTLLDVNIELLSSQRNVRVAEFEFARVLGLSRSTVPLRITDALPPVARLPDDRQLVELAMRQRVDARMATFQVHQAEKEFKLEMLKIIPSLVAGFDIEQSERRALPGRKLLADTARASVANGGPAAPAIQSRGERNIERSQIIDAVLGPTLTITLPIWDQNQAQIAKARFRVLQRRQEFENVLDQVALEVQRSAAQARNAVELWTYYEKEALPAADETVQGARQVYQQGQQSILALIEAQRSLVTRRAAFVQVKRAYAVAMAQLEVSVGGRLSEIAASRPSSESQPSQN